MKNILIGLLLNSVLGIYSNLYGQNLLFVSEGSSGNGSSWSNAYGILQEAIDASSVGDTILVAEGTYIPEMQWDVWSNQEVFDDPRKATFILKEGITLLGGFVGNETVPTAPETLASRDFENNATVLSGDLNRDDVLIISGDTYDFQNYEENSYHVVSSINLEVLTVVDGFTIRGGYANGGNSFESANNSGAGWYINGTWQVSTILQLKNITMTENYAAFDGGALHSLADAAGYVNLTIEKSIFRHNYAEERGGGLVFTGGLAGQSIHINKCIIEENISNIAGGGLYIGHGLNLESVDVTIQNSIIANNKATSDGGGIFFSSFETAAPDNLNLINCTIANNSSQDNGGGIYMSANNAPQFVFINNCILWDNEGVGNSWYVHYDQGLQGDFLLSVSYTLVEETSISELKQNGGILDLDEKSMFFNTHPLFVGDNDYQLTASSPVIDQGDNLYYANSEALDLLCNERIVNDVVDLGAYEYIAEVVTSTDGYVTDQIKIYPNPTSQFLRIHPIEKAISNILIYDLKGNILLHQNDITESASIDVSNLPTGVYIVRLGKIRFTFIKE